MVFISGVARGQGREHAIRFASEGASIIGVDLCAELDHVPYPLSTPEDLAETTRLVEAAGGASVLRVADVRNRKAMVEVVKEGMDRFGRLDVICANAGTYSAGPTQWLHEDAWDETIDVNLSGVYRTVVAGLKHMVAGQNGGSIVITSSTAGLKGFYGSPAYCAAKHGVVGFMKSLALELAPNNIRVNTVHPTSVDTPMIHNDIFPTLVAADKEHPTWADAEDFLRPQQPLGLPTVAPGDISEAVLWLSSDEARYVTGITLPIDAGALLK